MKAVTHFVDGFVSTRQPQSQTYLLSHPLQSAPAMRLRLPSSPDAAPAKSVRLPLHCVAVPDLVVLTSLCPRVLNGSFPRLKPIPETTLSAVKGKAVASHKTAAL